MPYVVNHEEQEAKRNSDKWIQPEEMIETTNIQLKSLIAFAEGLGYYFHKTTSKYFSSDDYDNKRRSIISFQTMSKLHNNVFQDWHGGDRFKYPFNFSTYKIRKARAAKIVNIVNLQVSKKTKYIRASSNIVSFVHQEYEGFLDLKPEHLKSL